MTLLNPAGPLQTGALDLRRVSVDHWILHDHAYPPSDARHEVASLHRTSDRMIEVIWLRTNLAMRTRYRSADEVLRDVASWRRQPPSSRKPFEIPHFPPPTV